jgi:arginase
MIPEWRLLSSTAPATAAAVHTAVAALALVAMSDVVLAFDGGGLERYKLVALMGLGFAALLAGDCLTSLGLVAGLQRQHHNISVIWLDAHGDFNTPAISASGYLAGMSLAMLTGRAPELICEGLGLRPVPDEQAVLIDGRDLDPAERDALEASRVQRLAADPGAIRSALNDLPLAAVYLHVDVDIIDSEDLPGLRFPTDDGPSFSVVEECLAQIVAAAPPIAASIACAWASDRIGDESTRRGITRLAGAIGAELHWPVDDARCGG